MEEINTPINGHINGFDEGMTAIVLNPGFREISNRTREETEHVVGHRPPNVQIATKAVEPERFAPHGPLHAPGKNTVVPRVAIAKEIHVGTVVASLCNRNHVITAPSNINDRANHQIGDLITGLQNGTHVRLIATNLINDSSIAIEQVDVVETRRICIPVRDRRNHDLMKGPCWYRM